MLFKKFRRKTMKKTIVALAICAILINTLGCTSSSSSETTIETTIETAAPTINDVVISANISLSDDANISVETARLALKKSNFTSVSSIDVSGNVIYKTNIFGSADTYSLGIKVEQNDKIYVWGIENIVVTAGSTVDLGDITLMETGLSNLDVIITNLSELNLSSIEYSFSTNILGVLTGFLDDSILSSAVVDDTYVITLIQNAPQGSYTTTANISGVKQDDSAVTYEEFYITDITVDGGVTSNKSYEISLTEI
jgi:hypothetical protein